MNQRDNVYECTNLIEVEHQIKFTYIVEILIQHLDKVVYGF